MIFTTIRPPPHTHRTHRSHSKDCEKRTIGSPQEGVTGSEPSSQDDRSACFAGTLFARRQISWNLLLAHGFNQICERGAHSKLSSVKRHIADSVVRAQGRSRPKAQQTVFLTQETPVS